MFNLVREFLFRPWMPPPFILFNHIWRLLRWCCNGCKNTPESSDFRKRFNEEETKQLIQWENIIARTYPTKIEASQADSVEGRKKVVINKLESIQSKVDFIPESQSQLQSDINLASSLGGAPPPPVTTVSPIPQAPIRQIIQLPPQLDQRLVVLEEQMVNTFRALNWIMQSMEASSMGCGVSKPILPDPSKQKDKEKSKDKKKKRAMRKQAGLELDRRVKLHIASQNTVYPGTFIDRFPVPDEKVPWNVEYEDYEPVMYTSERVLSCREGWADRVDLVLLSPKERVEVELYFNDIDTERKVSRISYTGHYKVEDGLPLNPIGRTGIVGRGALGRWGPNIAGDPLVTRWKYDEKGKCVISEGKPVMEFIAVKRADNKMWALPGAILRPGEQCWDMLTKYFSLEALGSLMDDPKSRQEIDRKLMALSQKGQELYKGYADDARNTDNAWLETCVVNYHDDDGTILQHFEPRAGPGTKAVSWLTASSKLALHGLHLYFVKLAAEKHKAMF